jgi:hypothetical protein
MKAWSKLGFLFFKPLIMKPRTEIINHRIVNSVEQLVSFLHPGDLFRKRHSKTQYRFDELKNTEKIVVCENMETHDLLSRRVKRLLLIVAGGIFISVVLIIAFISPITKYLIEKNDVRWVHRKITLDWVYVNQFT